MSLKGGSIESENHRSESVQISSPPDKHKVPAPVKDLISLANKGLKYSSKSLSDEPVVRTYITASRVKTVVLIDFGIKLIDGEDPKTAAKGVIIKRLIIDPVLGYLLRGASIPIAMVTFTGHVLEPWQNVVKKHHHDSMEQLNEKFSKKGPRDKNELLELLSDIQYTNALRFADGVATPFVETAKASDKLVDFLTEKISSIKFSDLFGVAGLFFSNLEASEPGPSYSFQSINIGDFPQFDNYMSTLSFQLPAQPLTQQDWCLRALSRTDVPMSNWQNNRFEDPVAATERNPADDIQVGKTQIQKTNPVYSAPRRSAGTSNDANKGFPSFKFEMSGDLTAWKAGAAVGLGSFNLPGIVIGTLYLGGVLLFEKYLKKAHKINVAKAKGRVKKYVEKCDSMVESHINKFNHIASCLDAVANEPDLEKRKSLADKLTEEIKHAINECINCADNGDWSSGKNKTSRSLERAGIEPEDGKQFLKDIRNASKEELKRLGNEAYPYLLSVKEILVTTDLDKLRQEAKNSDLLLSKTAVHVHSEQSFRMIENIFNAQGKDVDYAKIVTLCDAALELDPQPLTLESYITVAGLMLQRGQVDCAKQLAQKAVNTDGENPYAASVLSQVYENENMLDQAIACLKNFHNPEQRARCQAEYTLQRVEPIADLCTYVIDSYLSNKKEWCLSEILLFPLLAIQRIHPRYLSSIITAVIHNDPLIDLECRKAVEKFFNDLAGTGLGNEPWRQTRSQLMLGVQAVRLVAPAFGLQDYRVRYVAEVAEYVYYGVCISDFFSGIESLRAAQAVSWTGYGVGRLTANIYQRLVFQDFLPESVAALVMRDVVEMIPTTFLDLGMQAAPWVVFINFVCNVLKVPIKYCFANYEEQAEFGFRENTRQLVFRKQYVEACSRYDKRDGLKTEKEFVKYLVSHDDLPVYTYTYEENASAVNAPFAVRCLAIAVSGVNFQFFPTTKQNQYLWEFQRAVDVGSSIDSQKASGLLQKKMNGYYAYASTMFTQGNLNTAQSYLDQALNAAGDTLNQARNERWFYQVLFDAVRCTESTSEHEQRVTEVQQLKVQTQAAIVEFSSGNMKKGFASNLAGFYQKRESIKKVALETEMQMIYLLGLLFSNKIPFASEQAQETIDDYQRLMYLLSILSNNKDSDAHCLKEFILKNINVQEHVDSQQFRVSVNSQLQCSLDVRMPIGKYLTQLKKPLVEAKNDLPEFRLIKIFVAFWSGDHANISDLFNVVFKEFFQGKGIEYRFVEKRDFDNNRSLVEHYLYGLLAFCLLEYISCPKHQIELQKLIGNGISATLIKNQDRLLDEILKRGYLPAVYHSIMKFFQRSGTKLNPDQVQTLLHRYDFYRWTTKKQLELLAALYRCKDLRKENLKLCEINFYWRELVRPLLSVAKKITDDLPVLVQEAKDEETALKSARKLLSAGANPDHKNILHICVKRRWTRMVSLLCDYGTKVNLINPYGMTSLQYCVVQNQSSMDQKLIDIIKVLAKHDGSYDMQISISFFEELRWRLAHDSRMVLRESTGEQKLKSSLGTALAAFPRTTNKGRYQLEQNRLQLELEITSLLNLSNAELLPAKPMISAATTGDVRQVLLALHNGAPIEQKDEKLQATPLCIASNNGHYPTAKALIKQKANVNARQADQKTPLVLAVQAKHGEVVELLLQSGADVKATVEEKNVLSFAETPEHEPIKKQLLNQRLLLACEEGDQKQAKECLDKGADINCQDLRDECHGMTPLMHAAKNKHPELLRTLFDCSDQSSNQEVKHVLLLNQQDKQGRTAIAHAISSADNDKVIGELIKKDIDLSICDAEGLTPYARAMKSGLSSYSELLSKALQSMLLDAVTKGDALKVRKALIAGAKPNERDAQGWPVLFLAVYNKFHDVARELLQFGADPNLCVDAGSWQNWTPLIYIVYKYSGSYFPIFELMLEKKGNANAVVPAGCSWKGWSLLAMACHGSFIIHPLYVIQTLLKYDAEPDQVFIDGINSGVSLIGSLLKQANYQAARCFLEAGADPTLGKKPMSLYNLFAEHLYIYYGKQKNKKDSIYCLLKGHTLFYSGDYKQAIFCYSQIADGDPSFAAANFFIAKAHVALKDYEKALPFIEKAVQYSPTSRRYQSLHIEIKQSLAKNKPAEKPCLVAEAINRHRQKDGIYVNLSGENSEVSSSTQTRKSEKKYALNIN